MLPTDAEDVRFLADVLVSHLLSAGCSARQYLGSDRAPAVRSRVAGDRDALVFAFCLTGIYTMRRLA
jgi:hypothetical protein